MTDCIHFHLEFFYNITFAGFPQQVLMRALRDFNIPKIVSDDYPVFMGLIGDLFPALNVPRKRDFEFEGQIKRAVTDLHLQDEDSFVLKVREVTRCLRHPRKQSVLVSWTKAVFIRIKTT